MTIHRKATGAFLLISSVAAFAPFSAEAKVHTTKVYTIRDEAGRLMKDVEERAYELHDHALSIQAANPNQLDHDFYVGESSSIRDDVNTLGKMMAKLKALESSEQSADKEVVDRATVQLAKVAGTTEEFIKYLTDNPGRFADPKFREITTGLWEQSGALWTLLHDSVKLGDLKLRETHLQQDLAKVTTQTP